ncbi:hypothetical protein DH2020_002030 [Rehmannia glutinosa]|uniref:Uncharacterized protein n=1 Tax=Rehmannia glutinosa TaxID=99300 RepID=A0ABR0XST2_REHGL
MMHGMSGSTVAEKANMNTEENLPAAEADNRSNRSRSYDEHVQNDDNLYVELETTAKIGENAELLQIKENSPLELDSSTKSLGSSDIQNGNLPPINGDPAAESGSPGKCLISSDAQSQNEAAWYSNAPEEYSQLLNKYYELEGQRQQVLQQLNQYNNWNYQNPISNTPTSDEYQASVPQPYDTVTCYCPYGCQNWVVPINSLPGSYSGGTCIGKICNAISKESQSGNSMSSEDPDFVKTAMVAAERALASLTKEANGVKDKELVMETGNFAESTKSSTDLDVVLKAWYSAGFYTGNLWKRMKKVKAFEPSTLSRRTVVSGEICYRNRHHMCVDSLALLGRTVSIGLYGAVQPCPTWRPCIGPPV